jgi:hypothetical protein
LLVEATWIAESLEQNASDFPEVIFKIFCKIHEAWQVSTLSSALIQINSEVAV